MDNDLISREALKKAIEGLVVGGAEGLKNYYENGSKSDENAWIGGIYDAWELINNAPTVEPPNQLVLRARDDAELEQLKTAWGNGEICFTPIVAYTPRPQGEWIIDDGEWLTNIYPHINIDANIKIKIRCKKCGKYTIEKSNFCPNCGASMM